MYLSILYFKGLLVKLRGPDEMLFYKDGDNTALTSGIRHAYQLINGASRCQKLQHPAELI